MSKRMLIDASHPEETRVVVLDGQKVEEFDFEAASKRPLKGNIYLAKVTRVEPSLQAAFVEYGGNRQGFLAFSEIHPDYYQIPVADRQALLAEQQAEARRRAEEEFEPVETGTAPISGDEGEDEEVEAEEEGASETLSADTTAFAEENDEEGADELTDRATAEPPADGDEALNCDAPDELHLQEQNEEAESPGGDADSLDPERAAPVEEQAEEAASDEQQSEHVTGEESPAPVSEASAEAAPGASAEAHTQALHSARPGQRWVRRRHYKIQEVIKRRQIILVQVVKEERGNKGAALTTYLSLAGRYCVLMPNTPRGGGISRKITNANDRKRLKSAAATLELPEGMGLIIRTAGENRSKVEIKRDYEYLLRMWDTIRETTLNSNAPARVYEEGDLIKRAIRDLYNKDVTEIVVEGDEGYRNAKEFMRMLMPSHAKNVKQYKAPVPLFQRQHIEAQLDSMFQPVVTLKSGGYIVINQTEALVSIDVNSGRATREHSIEETATKTNLEAADEIARQLRLRDLAGLIVIDFIDMEDSRNDRAVEKRLRDAVKSDRARIQIGKVSQFGLLEMSRQRLRAGVIAGSTVPCPHCGGQGIVRSVESTALRVLRGLEEEGQKMRSAAVTVRVPTDVAMYTLNQKRRELARIENEYKMAITFSPKEEVLAGNFEIERTAQLPPEERPSPASTAAPETVAEAPADLAEEIEETEEHEDVTHAQPPTSPQSSETGSGSRRRRRRRRGRSSSHHTSSQSSSQNAREETVQIIEQPAPSFSDRFGNDDIPDTTPTESLAEIPPPQSGAEAGTQSASASSETGGRRRRRRRRGGRNRHGNREASAASPEQDTGQPAEAESGSELLPMEDAVPVANTPSEPMWTLHAESEPAPVHRPLVPEPEEDTKAESSADTTEAHEPPRQGWWQRTFRS